MNILFVHSIGRNKYGGGEKWVIAAAGGLMDRGHRVIVGGRSGSKLLKAALERGLEIVEFDILSDISLWQVFRVAAFLRKVKIDVIITKGRELFVAGLAARNGGKPLVLVRHGSPLRSSFRKHSFLHRRLADGIITNTKTIKDFFEGRRLVRKGFARVIYNGLITDSDSLPYDFSARFPGRKIVLSAGRLDVAKGYLYLIDAITMLKDSRDDLMFVVLGEGKHLDRFVSCASKKGVSDLISFEGYADNVVPYLKGCDMFILPSLYEGMPNAVMEAMAYGKAVIMTRVNGAEELIPDTGKGILIPPADADAIAGSVNRLAESEEMREKMGGEAARFIKENFSVSGMIDNIESYIEEKLEEKSAVNR